MRLSFIPRSAGQEAVPTRSLDAGKAQKSLIGSPFSRLKDYARIALRRDKTRHSWIGFALLTAAMADLRFAKSGHRP